MNAEQETPYGPAEDHSIALALANARALAISIPLTITLWGLYAWFQPDDPLLEPLGTLSALASLLLAIVVAVSIHEAIHGLGWALFGRAPLRRVRFGLAARTLNPFAHMLDPIPARAYRWGTALPGLILGLLPCATALAAGSAWWMLFGLTLTLAAGGDMLVLWLLRGVDGNALVIDHPSRAGCLVLRGEQPILPSAPPVI